VVHVDIGDIQVDLFLLINAQFQCPLVHLDGCCELTIPGEIPGVIVGGAGCRRMTGQVTFVSLERLVKGEAVFMHEHGDLVDCRQIILVLPKKLVDTLQFLPFFWIHLHDKGFACAA